MKLCTTISCSSYTILRACNKVRYKIHFLSRLCKVPKNPENAQPPFFRRYKCPDECRVPASIVMTTFLKPPASGQAQARHGSRKRRWHRPILQDALQWLHGTEPGGEPGVEAAGACHHACSVAAKCGQRVGSTAQTLGSVPLQSSGHPSLRWPSKCHAARRAPGLSRGGRNRKRKKGGKHKLGNRRTGYARR